MKSVTGTEYVDGAIRATEKKVAMALQRINREAGKLLSKGDYKGSESLVQVAKTVQEFQNDVIQLRNKWKLIIKPAKEDVGNKGKATPLWEYYKLILITLESLGGLATREKITEAFEQSATNNLKGEDLSISKNGMPLWQEMIRKAKNPMIKQGFIDSHVKGKWQISALGRQSIQSKKQTI